MCWKVFILAAGSVALSFSLDVPVARLARWAGSGGGGDNLTAISRCGAASVASILAAAGLMFWSKPLLGPAIASSFRPRDVARAAGLVVATALAAPGIAWLLKTVIGRARPQVDHWNHVTFRPWAFDEAFSSFPSGQAALAGALAVSLCRLLPRARLIILLFGIAVGFSRIAVGAHWLSDVVAGWMLGASIAFALHSKARR